jgi:hypothetical protein
MEVGQTERIWPISKIPREEMMADGPQYDLLGQLSLAIIVIKDGVGLI